MNLIRLVAAIVFFSHSLIAGQLLLKNAHLIDPMDGQVRVGHLLINDDKIAAVLDSTPARFHGEVLDVSGKWVLPGLHDLHTHVHGNLSPTGGYQPLGVEGSARAMLYSGVTGFLDLFHNENEILTLRDRQRTGQLTIGPLSRIFAAGPIFTSTGGHGTEYGMFTRVIDSPEQAELEVRALAYKKPDVIKLVYDHALPQFTTLTKPTLKRALEVARDLKIKTVIHIGTWEDAEQAIDYGADAITHTFASPIPAGLVRKFKDRGVAYIPTLTVQMELNNIIRNPALLEKPLLTELVPSAFLATFKDESKFQAGAKGFLAYQRAGYAGFQKNFQALAEAGVRVIAGTDSGNFGVFQGYSLHRELELMVQAGASALLALQSATTNACAFFGQECGLRVGNNADLLVVEDSPLQDVANTQRIAYIVQNGQRIDRRHLRDLVSKVPAQLPPQVGGGIAIPAPHAH